MTISSSVVQTAGSPGNGATTQFSFSFHIDDYGGTEAEDQVTVIRETVSSGAEQTLVRGTDYSVSINGDQDASPGGSITMLTGAPSSSFKIWIRLSPTWTQATDYANQGGFLAETVEDQADQQQRMLNVLQDRIRRAPHVGIQAGTSFDGEITGDLTAGYVPIVKTDLSGWQLGAPASVAVSAAMTPVVQAPTILAGTDLLAFSNAAWLRGRNTADDGYVNMWRVNADDFVEPGACIGYDNTGAWVDRNVPFYQATYRNIAPTTIHAATFTAVVGKGDNTTFIGVSGGYIVAIDDPSVDTDAERGVLYGLQIAVQPARDRNNFPYDDAVCLVLTNDGLGKATELLYIGKGTHELNPTAGAAIGIAANAVAGIYLIAAFGNGIDFSRGLASPATFTGAAMRTPNNTTALSARNQANNADLPLIATNASDVMILGGSGVASIAASAPFRQADGSQSAPAYSFTNATNYGMYFGSSLLAFAVNGNPRAWLDAGGANVAGYVRPSSNDVGAIGSATLSWSDLFLASGGVINWNNGTYTVTQASAVLTASGTFVAAELRASGDVGGAASHNSLTNVSDLTANSTGVGSIKFKGATSRDSSGFIKFYIGTTAYYVPVFSAISG